jgi:hypothetical protein
VLPCLARAHVVFKHTRGSSDQRKLFTLSVHRGSELARKKLPPASVHVVQVP